jgi:hypothetical protein
MQFPLQCALAYLPFWCYNRVQVYSAPDMAFDQENEKID